MADTLRAGVIGCGVMGADHARLYAEMADVELAVVMDPAGPRARELAGLYGCEVCTDLDTVAEFGLDVVSVCVDDRYHRESAVRMARCGTHVLIEKPLATTLEDCDAIIQAAQQAGVKLMVGHCVRFDPRYHGAYQSICHGDLGEISTAYARRVNTLSSAQRIGGRVELPFYLGVHDIDILRWLVGSEIRTVHAAASKKVLPTLGIDAADAYHATFGFDNGAIGALELSWAAPDGMGWTLDAVCTVTGTKGMVRIDVCGEGYTKADGSGVSGGGVTYGYELGGRLYGALQAEVAHFVSCVVQDRPPLIASTDARRAVEVAIAMVESARTGETVTL